MLQKVQVNWASIVEQKKLVLGSTHDAKVAGIFPNRKAWSLDYPRIGAIAVFQGQEISPVANCLELDYKFQGRPAHR